MVTALQTMTKRKKTNPSDIIYLISKCNCWFVRWKVLFSATADIDVDREHNSFAISIKLGIKKGHGVYLTSRGIGENASC